MSYLLINYEYPPIGGGAANATYFLAQALNKAGHRVIVLTSGFEKLQGYSLENQIHIYRLSSSRKSSSQSNIYEMLSFIFHAFMFIRKLYRKEKPKKIIAFFTIPSGIPALCFNFLYKIPYIISLRGGDVPEHVPELKNFHRKIAFIRRLILKKATAIVANSTSLKNLSQRTDHFPVEVIPNGVDTQFFKYIERNANNESAYKFLFVGRLHKEKNIEIIINQLAAIKSKYLFEFHVVGNGGDYARLKQIAIEKQIYENIIWHGWLSKNEIREIYSKVDCLINPSLYEGMPNVVLEAMACGLPIIASKVGGNEAVVKHNETGFLFNLKQSRELQFAIIKLLKNREIGIQLGKTGREWVVNEFSWDTTAIAYHNLFISNNL